MSVFLHNIHYDKFNIQLGNTLLNTHIDTIMQAFDSKTDIAHFAASVLFETIVAELKAA